MASGGRSAGRLGGALAASPASGKWWGARRTSGSVSSKQGSVVDQRMHLEMRCRLSPTADVPSQTSGAAMGRHTAYKMGEGKFQSLSGYRRGGKDLVQLGGYCRRAAFVLINLAFLLPCERLL
jgi:hypothetical protein